MPPKDGGSYALVVYEKADTTGKKGSKKSVEKQTFYDIVELRLVPVGQRFEGRRTKVKWLDSKTKKITCHYVQIKKISKNKGDLEKLIVNNSGEIVNPDVSIFTEEVYEERHNQQAAKKSGKVARNTASSQMEIDISKESNIFENSVFSVGLQTPPTTPETSLGAFKISTEIVTLAQSPFATSNADLESATVKCNGLTTAKNISDRKDSRLQHFQKIIDDLAAQVTDENINFLACCDGPQNITQATRTRDGAVSPTPFEIPDSYKTPGKGKVPIDDGSNFYLNEHLKLNIEKKSYDYDYVTRSCKKSWQLIVRQCLIQVYGKHLGEYSAKGAKGGCRPRIDTDLYLALWNWSKAWSKEDVEEPKYVEYINKLAYNRRKSDHQAIKLRSSSVPCAKKGKEKTQPNVAAAQMTDTSSTNKKRTRRSTSNPEVGARNQSEAKKTDDDPLSWPEGHSVTETQSSPGRTKSRSPCLNSTNFYNHESEQQMWNQNTPQAAYWNYNARPSPYVDSYSSAYPLPYCPEYVPTPLQQVPNTGNISLQPL